MDDEDPRPAAGGLADPQVQERDLLLRVQSHDDDRLRALDVHVGRTHRRRGRDQLRRPSMERAPMIEVVRPEGHPCELREGVRVFVEQAPAGEERHPATGRPLGDPGEHLAEGRGLEAALADQRRRHPAGKVAVAEGEPALVADPGVVHVRVVARQDPDDLSAAQVDPHVASGAAVLAHGVGARKVEGSGDEPVRRRRQGTHRADLHGVTREGRAEVLARPDRDAFAGAATEQLDEPVAADLVAEAGAPGAEHAPLAIEVHERRERDRLLEDAFRLRVPALTGPEGHRLVLERAFAAPVTDRAIERMVQQ